MLWTLARFVPLPSALLVGAAIPIVGLLGWLVAGVRSRPSIGETALAVDAEGGLGDRVSSALELAVGFPDSAGPRADDEQGTTSFDEAAETDRFVRRQRNDALGALRTASPGMFRPRLSRRPAGAALVAMLLLVPVLVLPNPQDAVIAQQQQVKEAAARQAEKLDRVAEELEGKGADADDPRTRLAQELRDLAQQSAGSSGGPRCQSRAAGLDRDRCPRADRSGQRATGVIADVAQPFAVGGGHRQARCEPRRGSPEGERRSQGPRREARPAHARAATRACPPAGRHGGDRLAGRWRRWDGIERRGPEPGAGRHGGRPSRRWTGSARR